MVGDDSFSQVVGKPRSVVNADIQVHSHDAAVVPQYGSGEGISCQDHVINCIHTHTHTALGRGVAWLVLDWVLLNDDVDNDEKSNSGKNASQLMGSYLMRRAALTGIAQVVCYWV